MPSKIKETKFGNFLKKVAPKLFDKIGDVLPDRGVLGVVKNLIDKDDEMTDQQKIIANNHLQEVYRLEIADRDSARKRESSVRKNGIDWMMLATGLTGLLSFVFIIYAIVYIPEVSDNKLFVHLMGMVEGIVVGNIFAYYYGTSAKK
jgi:hypothetical protein